MTLPTSGPFAAFWTNKKAEEDGVWVDAPGQFRVKLRRASPSNKPYQKALRDRYLGLDDRDSDDAKAVLQAIFAEHIIVDWDEGAGSPPHVVPGFDGPVAFSPEAAAELFSAMEEFWEWVLIQAQTRERFRVETIEADAKNSSPRSDTI